MLRTIIIDDQKLSSEMLADMLRENFPEIKIEQQCKSGAEGLKAIDKHHPDFIFLDVEMPGMSGFDMLKQIEDVNFEIIFTTGDDKYTIQAFHNSALDYLMKPISPDDLKASMERLIKRKKAQKEKVDLLLSNLQGKNKRTNRIALPTGDGLVFVAIKEIMHCDSDDNYTTIFTRTGEKMVVTRTLKEIEELISDEDFFRVHASHLINLSFIKKYVKGAGGYVVMADDTMINVARNRKEEFLEQLARG